MISLIVTLRVQREQFDAFLKAIEENAEHTSAESGCRQFDVVQDTADETTFVLYEVYDDRAALTKHRKAPHFLRWEDAEARIVATRSTTVRECTRLVHHANGKAK
jgi:autoinducer 2-degrading protein